MLRKSFAKIMSSDTNVFVKSVNEDIVHTGLVYKLGSVVKNWKLRKFYLLKSKNDASECRMAYLEPETDQIKGYFPLNAVVFSLSNSRDVDDFMKSNQDLSGNGFSIVMQDINISLNDSVPSRRSVIRFTTQEHPVSKSSDKSMTLVFRTRDEAVTFLTAVAAIAKSHNVYVSKSRALFVRHPS